MISSWKSRADRCPECQSPLKLEEGAVPYPLFCPECGRDLVLRCKHLKWLILFSEACGFLVAYVQKLEGPVFLAASLTYGFLFILALRRFVMPLLPHELTPTYRHIQGLGLDPPKRK
jgi:predicted RNA-binding Zn-ribbon protein involved in translation (DUF1610 family)